ncbi:MAG: peptide chain release factor N(5)-glutamine methyltransferase, partial [Aerococcus urinaeequi]
IISNPPYIGSDETDVMSKSTVLYEPDLALFAEENGYQIYWRLFDQIHDYLAKPGYFIGEFGYQQGQSLLTGAKDRLRMTDAEVNIIQDYAGNDRILVIQNPYNTTI